MLNETFIRKLNKIISEYASQPDDLVEQIVYLTNDLKNDIAEFRKLNEEVKVAQKPLR